MRAPTRFFNPPRAAQQALLTFRKYVSIYLRSSKIKHTHTHIYIHTHTHTYTHTHKIETKSHSPLSRSSLPSSLHSGVHDPQPPTQSHLELDTTRRTSIIHHHIRSRFHILSVSSYFSILSSFLSLSFSLFLSLSFSHFPLLSLFLFLSLSLSFFLSLSLSLSIHLKKHLKHKTQIIRTKTTWQRIARTPTPHPQTHSNPLCIVIAFFSSDINIT